ncbi:heterokaryon incompatibility protein-domain-containing protein [Paraphoma chrysanthemicola]|uniref:Heterokaryon incompatibility protein-domain-containing protein n=1 Tax=Paraphoma chrysanthemicola TaxID=798071 RepID=A0A8K0W1H7_9PLEO|nr:heterokaryon incompatibility protein-domain-containing protein [Paraphoma chrysanthemicola]
MDLQADEHAADGHNACNHPDEPLYKPLDDTEPEIRLIKVKRPQSDGPSETIIECSMSTVSLRGIEDQYVALSYAWGDTKDRKPITINGHERMVTVNLEAFLQEWRDCAVREDTPERYDTSFWIDAISINQEDMSERASQVNLMSRIYPSARAVMCWLGQGSRRCEHGLEAIARLGEHVKSFLDEDNPTKYLTKEAWLEEFYLEDDGDAAGTYRNLAWNGIRSLFAVEYWVRAWIQQEFALAKTVVFKYGRGIALLSHMNYVWKWWKGFEDQVRPEFIRQTLWRTLAQEPFRHLLGMEHHLQRLGFLELTSRDHTVMETTDLAFFTLYRALSDVKATDPRDMLYSLLGVMKLDIQANYALTVEDVYYQFAQRWIVKPGGLVFLLGAGGPCPEANHRDDSQQCQLPSWVPCWTSLSPGLGRMGIFIRKGESEADLTCSTVRINGKCLLVRGHKISTVNWDKSINAENLRPFLASYIHDPLAHFPNTQSRRLQLLLRLVCDDKHPTSRKPLIFKSSSWDEVLEALGTVVLTLSYLFSHSVSDIVIWLGLPTNADVAEKLLNEPLPPGVDPSALAVPSDRRYPVPAIATMLNANLLMHHVFTAEDGSLGWSLRHLQQHDIVCAIFGLEPLVILRQVGDYYRYIGPCSLQGQQDLRSVGSDFDTSASTMFNIY